MGTVNLFSRPASTGSRVFRHPQVVKDQTSIKAEFAHRCRDGLIRFLEGLEDADREAAQARDVFRTETGADAAAILIVVPVNKVMNAFDGPVAAVDLQ